MDCTIYKDTFVSRQPVFDASMDTWGHMLLHRHGRDDSWKSFESAYSSTTDVLACLPFLSGCLPPRHQTILHFPFQAIREDFPAALTPELTTMIIPGQVEPLASDVERIKDYRATGFGIALGCTPKTMPHESLLPHADILLANFATMSPERTRRMTSLAEEHGLKLMALNLASRDMFELAKECEFHYYHGTFFTEPEIHKIRTASAGASSRLNLFEVLLPDDPDFDALAHAIEPDVAITHRLLAFLNSAHFSFATEISSVHQAVVLAGWNPIRNWLRIILLTDLLPSRKSKELGYRSAHRAKFLELVAMRAGHDSIANALFLTGLFSLLDAILDMEMKDVLAHLPLSKDIIRSLQDNDGPFAPWLALTRTIEEGNWDKLGDIAMELDLPPGSVAESYRLAFQWADEFFGMPDQR